MHPRNKHQERYDLRSLARVAPELSPLITLNPLGEETIDFSDPVAVKLLNKAILADVYGVRFWDIPSEFLCPPIPGRADYVHSVSDLFSKSRNLRVLDIGTGANCIYPLIGVREYDWTYVGSDINKKALANATEIVEKNNLSNKIELRHQRDKTKIFTHIIHPDEKFDLTLCNPPFHESLQEASAGTQRKWKNLGKGNLKGNLNFGGQGAELWCPGGEKRFILQMIDESYQFKNQVRWFTSLVSKKDNLKIFTQKLQKLKALTKTLEMSQGQKKSRVLCWTYQSST